MYTNADVTLYLYSRIGRSEKYTRVPVEGVYWEDVRQSTFLKTGQRDSTSVMLIIPIDSLDKPLKFTQGKDLVVKNVITDEMDCSSQEAMSKSLAALKTAHKSLTVTTVDERLYGEETMQHYELACR